MCHELWSTSVIFFFKVSIGCVLFCFFAEWVHSPPHSCSLWEYQCSHVAVKSGCCCGLHCKGKCGVSYALFASSPLGNTFGTEVWEAHPTLRGLTWLSCCCYHLVWRGFPWAAEPNLNSRLHLWKLLFSSKGAAIFMVPALQKVGWDPVTQMLPPVAVTYGRSDVSLLNSPHHAVASSEHQV